MTNIADVMLNQRIDELADLERAIGHAVDHDLDLADEAQERWFADLEARRDHLRVLCLRGLRRCYPTWTEERRERMLAHQVLAR